jgi:hypothetical protein
MNVAGCCCWGMGAGAVVNSCVGCTSGEAAGRGRVLERMGTGAGAAGAGAAAPDAADGLGRYVDANRVFVGAARFRLPHS